MSMIWAICGAGRKVGKTTVAQSIDDMLDASVYCKCGHNAAITGKPENYFHTLDELTIFIDRAIENYSNIIVESNIFVHSGRPDITIYIDGVEGTTKFRDDTPQLKAAADIVIAPSSTHKEWKRILADKISDPNLIETLCQRFLQQQQWLFTS